MNINQDFVPGTITQAVDHIIESLTEEDKNFIKENPPERIHFVTGMAIRNAWSLWETDTPIKRNAINTYKIAHADDISGLIFAWVWAKINQQPFDPQEYCQRYHDHWAKMGITSIQAGR